MYCIIYFINDFCTVLVKLEIQKRVLLICTVPVKFSCTVAVIDVHCSWLLYYQENSGLFIMYCTSGKSSLSCSWMLLYYLENTQVYLLCTVGKRSLSCSWLLLYYLVKSRSIYYILYFRKEFPKFQLIFVVLPSKIPVYLLCTVLQERVI